MRQLPKNGVNVSMLQSLYAYIYVYKVLKRGFVFAWYTVTYIYIGLSTFIIWGDKVQHIYIMIKTAWSFA